MVDSNIILTSGVVLLLVAVYSVVYIQREIRTNPWKDKNILYKGEEKPRIWLYYDVSDVNSRWWADFGARSSRALNMPFLNLCYETIVRNNSNNYRVEVIGGLADLGRLLGGMDRLPSGLRDKIAPVNQAELNWIRSTILANFGGLWLSPYVVSLKSFGKLPEDKAVFFGSDPNETYAAEKSDVPPSFYCVWAPKANMPLFRAWEASCRYRIAPFEKIYSNEASVTGFPFEPYPKRGGEQIRGDVNWDWQEIVRAYSNKILINIPGELSRKRGGKRIQLEDILAAGTQGRLPFEITNDAIYLPIPWTELKEREMFGWFLRMSEEQIKQSDLAVKYLL
jgi:hypothetical protein